jgi:hypothetical protein
MDFPNRSAVLSSACSRRIVVHSNPEPAGHREHHGRLSTTLTTTKEIAA